MKAVKGSLIIISIFLLGSSYTSAQQDPQFSQHFLNPVAFNPSYAGMDNALSATTQFRSQYVGIEGHPVIQNLTVHSPVPLLHGGLGINLLNEQTGALRSTFLAIDYSYIIKTKPGNFSIGFAGGLAQINVDGSKLRSPDGSYQNGINHNDNILPIIPVSGFAADFSVGTFFTGRNLSVGIAANHVIPQTIKLSSEGSNLEFSLERQYYLQAGYLARLTKTFNLRPSIMMKSNGSALQAEGDLIVIYNNIIWAGAGYRGYNDQTIDAIVGLVGVTISENFRLGYSYDYTTLALKGASNGSHELVLNYIVNLMKPVRPGKVIYTPRF